jgi:threonine dehydrogenase-like Zn-dependent dehydrogenase
MKAIAKQVPTEPGIDILEVAEPAVQGPNDVLVRVGVSSISGSELNIWRGAYRRPNGNPVEPGRRTTLCSQPRCSRLSRTESIRWMLRS